jgi:RecB family exonuclease
MCDNLEPITPPTALWFGSAFHFAMECLHGKLSKKPELQTAEGAFLAYAHAWPEAERPLDYQEHLELGVGMLRYYERYWLPNRNTTQVVVLDGVPQVEVSFDLPIPKLPTHLKGRFDAVVTDAMGRLWVVDYKTAAQFNTSKLENDYQCTAYTWAAQQLYGRRFEGMIYQQHLKVLPTPPSPLKSGVLSQNKAQRTSSVLYRTALLELYGCVPPEYQEFLAYLMTNETPDADCFIRRDFVRRTPAELDAFERHLKLQIRDMANPRIYPNPTRDCSVCQFRGACIAADDGGDYQQILAEQFVPRRQDSPTRHDQIRERLLTL